MTPRLFSRAAVLLLVSGMTLWPAAGWSQEKPGRSASALQRSANMARASVEEVREAYLALSEQSESKAKMMRTMQASRDAADAHRGTEAERQKRYARAAQNFQSSQWEKAKSRKELDLRPYQLRKTTR